MNYLGSVPDVDTVYGFEVAKSSDIRLRATGPRGVKVFKGVQIGRHWLWASAKTEEKKKAGRRRACGWTCLACEDGLCHVDLGLPMCGLASAAGTDWSRSLIWDILDEAEAEWGFAVPGPWTGYPLRVGDVRDVGGVRRADWVHDACREEECNFGQHFQTTHFQGSRRASMPWEVLGMHTRWTSVELVLQVRPGIAPWTVMRWDERVSLGCCQRAGT